MAPEYLCSLEGHTENSGHPASLGSSHMVIFRLVLEPPLCGIGCRQILEMRHLLEILILF